MDIKELNGILTKVLNEGSENIEKQVSKALEEQKWIVQALDFNKDDVIFQHLFDDEHAAYIDFCKEIKKSDAYIEVVSPDDVIAYSTDELED